MDTRALERGRMPPPAHPTGTKSAPRGERTTPYVPTPAPSPQPQRTAPMALSPSASGDGTVRVVRIAARLNVGGVARHVAWLSAALQPPEYESVLVTGTVADGEEDMTAFALAQGVMPLRIPEMGRAISVKDVVTAWKLYRLLVRLRPAIIHTHTAKAGTLGRVAGWLYRWLTPATLVGRPRD